MITASINFNVQIKALPAGAGRALLPTNLGGFAIQQLVVLVSIRMA